MPNEAAVINNEQKSPIPAYITGLNFAIDEIRIWSDMENGLLYILVILIG